MRETRTSGLMSGEGKRDALCIEADTAPFLDSTGEPKLREEGGTPAPFFVASVTR